MNGGRERSDGWVRGDRLNRVRTRSKQALVVCPPRKQDRHGAIRVQLAQQHPRAGKTKRDIAERLNDMFAALRPEERRGSLVNLPIDVELEPGRRGSANDNATLRHILRHQERRKAGKESDFDDLIHKRRSRTKFLIVLKNPDL